MLSLLQYVPKLSLFWWKRSSAGQLSDFRLKCNYKNCFSCRFCLQRWSQLNFLWMSYFSGGFHDYYSLLGLKNQIQQFGAPVHPDSNFLKNCSVLCFSAPNQMCCFHKESGPMFCVSLRQFKCSIFSRDQSQYYVLLCTNSDMLKDQVQCASLHQI